MANDDLFLEVKAFATAINDRVKANRHKPHWRDEDADRLFAGLLDEVDELRVEIARENPDLAAVRHEAADVANYAMMIADKMGALMGGCEDAN